jgi:hypothetical protein
LGCAPTNPARRPKTEAAPSRLLRPDTAAIHAERIEGEFTLLDVPVGDVVVRICPSMGTEPAILETRMRAAALIRAVRRLGGTARTLLDANGSAPSRAESEIYDGKITRSYQVRFGPGASFDYEYSKTGEPMRRGGRTLPVEATIHDVHSALLLLRNWQPRLDEQAQFYVVLGRRLWRVDARSKGRTVLLVNGAPRVTTRIEGEAERVDASDSSEPSTSRRSFSLWFEDGAQRVPLRLTATSSYGDVTMTLTGYERSPEVCERSPEVR